MNSRSLGGGSFPEAACEDDARESGGRINAVARTRDLSRASRSFRLQCVPNCASPLWVKCVLPSSNIARARAVSPIPQAKIAVARASAAAAATYCLYVVVEVSVLDDFDMRRRFVFSAFANAHKVDLASSRNCGLAGTFPNSTALSQSS